VAAHLFFAGSDSSRERTAQFDPDWIFQEVDINSHIYTVNFRLQATDKATRVHLDKVFLGDILDLDNTGQSHTKPDLIHKQFQAKLNARLSLVCQTPQYGSSNPDKISSECESLENISTMSNTTVDVNRNLLLHRSSNFWKRVESSKCTV